MGKSFPVFRGGHNLQGQDPKCLQDSKKLDPDTSGKGNSNRHHQSSSELSCHSLMLPQGPGSIAAPAAWLSPLYLPLWLSDLPLFFFSHLGCLIQCPLQEDTPSLSFWTGSWQACPDPPLPTPPPSHQHHPGSQPRPAASLLPSTAMSAGCTMHAGQVVAGL